MKSEYVRIYSEEELHHKVQQTTALLKRTKEQVKNFHFCDIPLLKNIWIRYESTRYIVSESLLLDNRYYKEDSESLFIERQVEDNYSDVLPTSNQLHNGLVSMQFLYDTIQRYISYNLHDILPSQYQDPRMLVEEIASDIYCHIRPQESNEYQKMVNILAHLNYLYLYPSYKDVELVDVAIAAYYKEQENNKVLQKLMTSLDLVEE